LPPGGVHGTIPLEHDDETQVPPEQVSPTRHPWLQLPQLELSVCIEAIWMHLGLPPGGVQDTDPFEHGATQVPAKQLSERRHAWLQLPQLRRSTCIEAI
jgi:hypothetical protein